MLENIRLRILVRNGFCWFETGRKNQLQRRKNIGMLKKNRSCDKKGRFVAGRVRQEMACVTSKISLLRCFQFDCMWNASKSTLIDS